MDDTSCIVLLDFAENYHYVVQDKIQSYHWNKEQCTIHPVVLYHKDEQNELHCIAHPCVLSGDLEHDTNCVHELLRLTCIYNKQSMPKVTLIE